MNTFVFLFYFLFLALYSEALPRKLLRNANTPRGPKRGVSTLSSSSDTFICKITHETSSPTCANIIHHILRTCERRHGHAHCQKHWMNLRFMELNVTLINPNNPMYCHTNVWYIYIYIGRECE